jgi:hypothetical protein
MEQEKTEIHREMYHSVCHIFHMNSPNAMLESLVLLFRIQVVSGSNIDMDIDYRELNFRCIRRYVYVHAEIMP